MVNLQLYSRGEAKQYMEQLFTQITQYKYDEARETAVKLKNCLLKYYLTRNIDCDAIYEVFNEFDFLLRNCNEGRNKQDICFDFLKKIRAISQVTTTDPIARLHQLYEDLRFSYLHLSKENVESILDCFDEIRSLKPRMQERGDTAYNYYTYVLQNIGECESILVDLISIQGKVPDKSTIKNTIASFQKLFSSIQKVIAPPVVIKLSVAELSKQLKSHPLSEIAQATGHREEELQAMLNQIEMGGEE